MTSGEPVGSIRVVTGGKGREAPLCWREDLGAGQRIDGPAVIAEANATTVVEPEWRATVTSLNHLVWERIKERKSQVRLGTRSNRGMLRCSNTSNLSTAKRMGLGWRN